MPAETIIAPEVDALVDILEYGGASWHVIGGSAVIDPYLTFELPQDDELTAPTVNAIMVFSKLFRANRDIREAVIEHALSIGAYYVEIGNHRPVVGQGRTTQ